MKCPAWSTRHDLIAGKPELGVRIDRDKAADLGVQRAGHRLDAALLVGGLKVTDYNEGGEQYEVHAARRARVPHRRRRASRRLHGAVGRARHRAARATSSRRRGAGPSQINRLNRQRQVTLTAQHGARPLGDRRSIAKLSRRRRSSTCRPATRRAHRPLPRAWAAPFANFVLAFVLSFIFMYLMLAAQFESWLHPITILLALPLTVPFALFSILVLSQSLNIFSMLGILVLFGVVKKNAILQVDHTNKLRAQGLPRARGDPRANRDRLRPILMTTLAFVAGMIPLVALERHRRRRPTARRLRDHRRPDALAAAHAAGDAGGLLALRRFAGTDAGAEIASEDETAAAEEPLVAK